MAFPPRRKLTIKRWKRMQTVFRKVNELTQLCDTDVFLVVQHRGSTKKHIFHSNPELNFPETSWLDLLRKHYPPVRDSLITPDAMGPVTEAHQDEWDEEDNTFAGMADEEFPEFESESEAEVEAVQEENVSHTVSVGDEDDIAACSAVDMNAVGDGHGAPNVPRHAGSTRRSHCMMHTNQPSDDRATLQDDPLPASKRVPTVFKNESGPRLQTPDSGLPTPSPSPPHCADKYDTRRLAPAKHQARIPPTPGKSKLGTRGRHLTRAAEKPRVGAQRQLHRGRHLRVRRQNGRFV